jgi:serine phosphatase RsbU (regulator of sigma subunit)
VDHSAVAAVDAEGREPHRTLPVLLDRLNRVLPEVKEPHMYATFTGFRLGAEGSVFYALAASPPILQWHASGRTLSQTEEGQFPLGLLPVSNFDGQRLEVASGQVRSPQMTLSFLAERCTPRSDFRQVA